MLWIFLAILAHFLWALVNLADKYLLEKRISYPFMYAGWATLMGTGVSILFLPFIEFVYPSFSQWVLIISASCLYISSIYFYLRAIKIEEPTRINVWWNLVPVFALCIEVLFLNRDVARIEYAAIALLLFGAMLASIHIGKRAIVWSSVVWSMMFSCAGFALYAVLFGFLAEEIPFAFLFVLMCVCRSLIFVSFSVSGTFRKKMLLSTKELRGSTLILVALFALLDYLGIFVNNWAISLSNSAFAFAFEGTQVLFVFIIATLLSIFYPHIIKEEIDRKNILLKIAALVIIICGTVLMALAH